jgi:hypothetical protein
MGAGGHVLHFRRADFLLIRVGLCVSTVVLRRDDDATIFLPHRGQMGCATARECVGGKDNEQDLAPRNGFPHSLTHLCASASLRDLFFASPAWAGFSVLACSVSFPVRQECLTYLCCSCTIYWTGLGDVTSTISCPHRRRMRRNLAREYASGKDNEQDLSLA